DHRARASDDQDLAGRVSRRGRGEAAAGGGSCRTRPPGRQPAVRVRDICRRQRDYAGRRASQARVAGEDRGKLAMRLSRRAEPAWLSGTPHDQLIPIWAAQRATPSLKKASLSPGFSPMTFSNWPNNSSDTVPSSADQSISPDWIATSAILAGIAAVTGASAVRPAGPSLAAAGAGISNPRTAASTSIPIRRFETRLAGPIVSAGATYPGTGEP